jgi:hypothetical protein
MANSIENIRSAIQRSPIVAAQATPRTAPVVLNSSSQASAKTNRTIALAVPQSSGTSSTKGKVPRGSLVDVLA